MSHVFLHFCYCIINLQNVMILLIIFLNLISFNFVKLIDFIDERFLNDMILLFQFAQFILSVPSFFFNVFGHYFVGHELLSSKEKSKRFSYLS